MMTGGTKGCQTGEGAFARPHVNFPGGIDGDVVEPVTRVVDRFQAVNQRSVLERDAAAGGVAPGVGCGEQRLVTGSTTSPSIPPGKLTWGLAKAPSPV